MFSITKWIIQQRLNLFKVPRDMVRYSFRNNSEKIAIITDFKTIKYTELANRTFGLANGFDAINVNKGDSFFAMVADGSHQIEISLAGFETGAILTSLNINLNIDNVLAVAKQIKPKLFIYDPIIAKEVARLLKNSLPDLRLIEIGAEYQSFIDNYPPKKSKTKIYQNDVATQSFTSGTTGVPKILPITHGSFVKSLQLIIKNIDVDLKKKKPEVFLICIPLTLAITGVLLPSILSGATIVVPKKYNATLFLNLIQKHKATRLFITPSLLIDLLDHPEIDDYDLSSLNNVLYGTETLAVAKLSEAIKRFGPIFQQGYGSSEVLPPVSMLRPKDHLEGTEIASFDILTSAGKVIPEVTVKITDDNYQPLPYGEAGRILIKSPTLFKGYWNQPELNGRIFIDGWFEIGDVGRLSSDGRLHVLGRLADVLKINNRTIYPRHIEEIVHNHPSVKECSLVQVDNEVILAVSLRQRYRTNPDYKQVENEILNILKSKVEVYQMPNRIEFLEDLPRSYVTKVLRREVRDIIKSRGLLYTK